MCALFDFSRRQATAKTTEALIGSRASGMLHASGVRTCYSCRFRQSLHRSQESIDVDRLGQMIGEAFGARPVDVM